MSGCKLHRIAVACTLMAATGAMAQSSVTLFGVVSTGVDYASAGSNSQSRMISGGRNGSRLGFRGTEDLGGGMRVDFRLESGINADTGTLGQGGLAFGREASIALVSKAWGALEAGRLPTPYYENQRRVDAFNNNMGGGFPTISRNTAAGQRQLNSLYLQSRNDNSFKYVSPNWGGVKFELLANLTEGSTTVGKARVAAIGYTADNLDVVFTGGRQSAPVGGQGDIDAMTLGGSYDFKSFKLFAGYSKSTNDCTNCTGVLARVQGVAGNNKGEFRLLNVGARVPVGAFTLIGQVYRVQDRSEYTVDPGSRDATWLAVATEYALSKRTTLWASYARVNNKNGSGYVLGNGSALQGSTFFGSSANDSASNLGMGITHRF